jgi:putative serine protease PepD
MTTPNDAPRNEPSIYQGGYYYPAPEPQPAAEPQPALALEPQPGPALKRRRGRAAALAGVTAIALAVGSGAVGAGAVLAFDTHPTATTTASAATSVSPVANTSTSSIANVVAAVDSEVVSLTVASAQETDLGSGVIIKSSGLILTNNHVIAAAANGGAITVTFTDGKTAKATVVAADAAEDLAIVQASGVSGLTAATFADSSTVRVGDSVIAIGNELGLSNSVSAGIVSALHRKVSVAADDTSGNNPFSRGSSSATTTYPDAIQTDVAVNQGDSGGALFNMAGQVIGIDTAIATASNSSTGSVGISFAIASNDASEFIAKTLA